jgi:hypothetical protein
MPLGKNSCNYWRHETDQNRGDVSEPRLDISGRGARQGRNNGELWGLDCNWVGVHAEPKAI